MENDGEVASARGRPQPDKSGQIQHLPESPARGGGGRPRRKLPAGPHGPAGVRERTSRPHGSALRVQVRCVSAAMCRETSPGCNPAADKVCMYSCLPSHPKSAGHPSPPPRGRRARAYTTPPGSPHSALAQQCCLLGLRLGGRGPVKGNPQADKITSQCGRRVFTRSRTSNPRRPWTPRSPSPTLTNRNDPAACSDRSATISSLPWS